MACEQCESIREKDGIEPDCETGKECLIPPVNSQCRKVLRMISLVRDLKGLVDADTALRLHGATLEDLELMAAVEREIREHGRS